MGPISKVVGLFVAGMLAACSPVAPYKSTATELAQTEHVVSTAFSKTWSPLDSSTFDSLSEDDELRRRFWLDSCVNELGSRFDPAPGTAVRAVQIAECMYVRGWHLNVQDSVAGH